MRSAAGRFEWWRHAVGERARVVGPWFALMVLSMGVLAWVAPLVATPSAETSSVAMSSATGMTSPGAGALPLMLGGFRAIAADFFWLRVQLAWERGDAEAVERWSGIVTGIDPQVRYFWINSARMLAFDLADARLRETQGGEGLSEAQRGLINHEHAQRALARLEAGLVFHPEDPTLLIEMGNIHLHRRDDLRAAAACYARAAAQASAPAYTERIYAGLRWRLGERESGLAALRRHHDRLIGAGDGNVDPALIAGVLARIRAWELELKTSSQQ